MNLFGAMDTSGEAMQAERMRAKWWRPTWQTLRRRARLPGSLPPATCGFCRGSAEYRISELAGIGFGSRVSALAAAALPTLRLPGSAAWPRSSYRAGG